MEPALFEIFVDRGCSLCRREAGWLERLDRGRGRLRIRDVASAEFVRGDYGVTFDAAMRSIHGRWPDGRVIQGVDVFCAAYAAVGLGWLWRPTRLPGIRTVVDVAYRVFAKRRYERRRTELCARPGVDVAHV